MLTSARKYLFRVYKLILFGLSLLLLFPGNIFQFPGKGLDPSYNIGIHLAITNGSTFGQDIIFTYGPLGYLHSRLPLGISKVEYILWDFFFLAIFSFILVYVYWHLQSYISATLAFITLLIFSRKEADIETLFLPFLFLLFHHMHHGSPISLILASALSLILFYIKISTGFVAVALMLVYLIYTYLYPLKHSRRFVMIYGAIFLAALALSAYILNTDLPGYIWGGVHLVNDYNDAMFIYIKSNPFGLIATSLALAILIPWGLIFIFNLRYLKQNREVLLRYLYVSLYIFILFKYAFVRADEHILNFFQSISLAIGLLAFFSTRWFSIQVAGVMSLAMVLCLPYATGRYNPVELVGTLRTVPLQPLVAGVVAHLGYKYEGATGYVSQVFDPNYPTSSFEMADRKLPGRFLEKIGRQSVDVIPWEISYIYANQLTYNPRPIFQSYQAYNDYLDTKNRDKYLSDTAPEFILFEVESFDNQHPSFTESKTLLAILSRYQYVDDEDELILLQKRAEPLLYTELPPVQHEGELNQDIPIDQGEALLMMSFDIQYSLAGQLKRAFFQPPPLYITLKLDNGEEKEYKALKSVINGEVLANRLLDQTEAAIKFFKEAQTEGQVVTIRFHSPEAWGFRPNFSYSGKQLKFK